MGEWKTYRLGEICTTKGAQYSISEHWPIIQYLDTGNITYNKINDIQSIIIGKDTLPSRARKKVKKDDIIFSCVRPNQCHFGILTNPPDNLLVSTGFAVISVDKKFAVPHYVYYYITQDHIINYLQNIGEQAVSTYPTIKASDIENLKITLPPLEEQQRIAGILGSLDDKIELNRRINANLEAQAQALFRSWFVDFEPFRDGPFVDSELGKIPQGWKVGTLSEIADITMGQSPKGSSYNEEGNGIIFYQGRAEFGNRFPSIRLYTTEPTRIAEINSVLLSVRAPVGDINIAKNTCCIGRGLAAIKSKHGCNSFILYLLQSLKPLLEQYNGEGTVFGCINRKEIEGLSIIIPKESVINEFEKIVEKIDSEIKNLTIEQENLSALRDTLLPKLMAGEIKIN